MATPALDSDTILKATEDWSVTEQMTLAQAIMQRAAAQIPEEPPARTPRERSTWDALYGIAANGQEPPSDEQVARWLDERRMEKYGGK